MATQMVRQAKTKFKGLIARYVKANNKHFLEYIRSRKPAEEAVDKQMKGLLKEDRGKIAEKLNKFFAFICLIPLVLELSTGILESLV